MQSTVAVTAATILQLMSKNNERTNPMAILPTLPSLDLATKHMPTFFHNPCDGNNYLLRNNSIGWNPVLNGSERHLKLCQSPHSLVRFPDGSISAPFAVTSAAILTLKTKTMNHKPYQVLFTPCDRSNYPLEPTPLTEHPVLNGSDQHLKAVSVSTLTGSLS